MAPPMDNNQGTAAANGYPPLSNSAGVAPSTQNPCNAHGPYNKCPEGSHLNNPFAPHYLDIEPVDVPGFNWVELEELELRARRVAGASIGQMADLLDDLADTCELLAALTHHQDALDNPGPQPPDIEENIIHYTQVHTSEHVQEDDMEAGRKLIRDMAKRYEDERTRREWSEQEIADLVRQYAPHVELTNLERVTGRNTGR